MAVETTTDFSGPYNANGATVAFGFTFIAMAADEISVILRDEGGVDSIVSPSLYTVALNVDRTGTVTFTTAPASGNQVFILSDVSFEHSIDREDGSPWKAAPENKVNDRAAARDIWLKGRLARTLMVPVGETAPPLASLANADGKVLGMIDGELVPIPNAAVDVEEARLSAQASASEAAEARNDVAALIALNAALESEATLLADVAAEVAAASAGAYWITEKEYLFQDDAGTTPVTATGQTVKCIKSANGVADYDLIQADSGKAGVYLEAYGIGFVRCADGDGFYSRSTVSLKVPSYIGVAAKFAGVVGRYLFGYNKNTNTRHMISSSTLSNFEGAAYGDAADLNRPLVQALSANYSTPPGPVHVMESLLASSNVLDAVFENSTYRGTQVELPTTWIDADTVTGMRLCLNASSTATTNADASCDFYGGVVMAREPTNRASIAKWLQLRSRPQFTSNDEVFLIIGDSTGDDIGTATGLYGAELGYRLAEELVTRRPSNCIILSDWNKDGDTFMGMQRFSNGKLLKRTFIINCSSAGSQPAYFFGERFSSVIKSLPKVDYVIWNHGHNLYTVNATIAASADRKYLRAGQFMETQDEIRRAFPKARHIMIRTYPRRTDEGIEPVAQAVDYVADKYGDIEIVDLYAHWDGAGRPSGWYVDGVHPTIPTGVDNMITPFMTVFDALPAIATATPPLIDTRKILPSENLLTNGTFETWTAGVPDNWTVFGGATVSKVGARAKVAGTDSGISQTISCGSGQVYTLVVTQEIVDGSIAGTGAARFRTDIGAIGDGRWIDPPHLTNDRERQFYFQFKTPVGASTMTVELSAGIGGAGTIYVTRAVLVAGEDPKDIIT